MCYSMNKFEKTLKEFIDKSVRKALNEGIYNYPDGIDHLILLSENDKDCYDIFWNIVSVLKKKFDKGVELSIDKLVNSSIMKKYQQYCFRKFKHEQDVIGKDAPYQFRRYMSERIIDRINGGEY